MPIAADETIGACHQNRTRNQRNTMGMDTECVRVHSFQQGPHHQLLSSLREKKTGMRKDIGGRPSISPGAWIPTSGVLKENVHPGGAVHDEHETDDGNRVGKNKVTLAGEAPR